MARIGKDSILSQISGAIGKQLVVKQYASGPVLSKYPDMSRVKSSKLQKLKQGWFAEAVKYAQSILRNPEKKKSFAKKLKKGERVYNAAIKEFLRSKKG